MKFGEVVSIDKMITKDQIDILENRPDVIYLRTGDYEGENPSVIVSTKNSGNRIIDRIEKFIKKILMRTKKQCPKSFMTKPELLFQKRSFQLGVGNKIEQITGLAVSRILADLVFPNDGYKISC